ncbi:MAG TPA: ROK family protein [Bryobacteraceae bacterium]|jgi:predicted NBD/HSP70 family sugar kinase
MATSGNGDSRRIQGASSEIVRDINKRIVLNLMRARQPISRADLARASGLQRSTISLIVEDLIGEHWIIEGPTARLPRGRRPTFLRLNEERVIIGVDVRPTQTTVALSDINGKFTSREVIATPADPAAGIAALTACIRRMQDTCGNLKIEGVGVSLPGRLHRDSGRLAFAPNLKWAGVEIRAPLEQATGLEVQLENAANACVLAAVWFDHTPCRDLVVVTVSEGIGTGVLVNGQLARGSSGLTGEFGHVPLDPHGPECSCGGRGCWELFGSNRAALRYYFEPGPSDPNLTFTDLMSLADQGVPRAAQALDRMAHSLGRGMRIVVAGLDPEEILVVGDLTRSWQRFDSVIAAEVQAQVLPGGKAPRIVPVHEGGMARLRGTVALVLQKHFASPESQE